MTKKRINRRRRGLNVEKIVVEILRERSYLAWRPPKIKFFSQDILGLFDVIALNRNELRLIQVQRERKRPYKIRPILKLPIPKRIVYELWVYKSKIKDFEIYRLK